MKVKMQPTLNYNFSSLSDEQKMSLFIANYKQLLNGKELIIDENFLSTANKILEWSKKDNWLYIVGNVGVGKTLWARTIQKTLNQFIKNVREGVFFQTWYYAKATDIVIKRGIEENFYFQYCNVKRLIIDDLGTEPTTQNIYGTNFNTIADIIYNRADNNKQTIITTNLDKNQILNRYGKRVYDRIRGNSISIAIVGDSYRICKKQ